MIVKLTCRGITPLLMARMTEDVLEGLRTGRKKPVAAKIGKTRTPRDEAEEKLHTLDGVPIIPGQNMMACLIAAGIFVRLDGKRQISTGKATVLPGLMWLLDPVIQLHDPDSKKSPRWEVDIRRGRNPNGGQSVCICRPRFDLWAFTCRVDIDEEEIGEVAIRDLWDKAGKRVGLGDFRPSRKGIFGQFVVERWVREEGKASAAAE